MRSGASLRARSTAQTAAQAQRQARRLGVSRVIDITALDKLGMPVCVSLRPGGEVARLHAGKGETAADARLGAQLEAVECAVAEQAGARGPYAQLPLAELAARLPDGLSLSDFAPCVDAVLRPDRPTLAVRCHDLMSRRRPLLPAELVMVPSPDEGLPPLFGWSSNGLACGSTLQEASLHALLEVLERDTITMSAVRRSAAFVETRSLPEPFLGRAARWQQLGVQLHVRHLPGDFDLPCFEATLYEPGGRQAELARGWGIHFDRDAALARAVGEAAQVRLCSIHSGQAGMAGLYGNRLRGDSAASARAREQFLADLAAVAPGIEFRASPHKEQRSIDSALKDLLGRLRRHGFRHAFRYRMRRDDGAALPGVHVVKMIVPRCETVLGASRRVGPRLLREVAARC